MPKFNNQVSFDWYTEFSLSMYGGIQSLTVLLIGQLLKCQTDLCFVFSFCVLEQ